MKVVVVAAPVLLLAVFVSGSAGADGILAERTFEMPRGGEVIATIAARCDRCAWDVEGREAVTLTLWVNGRYSQHLPLVRTGRAAYRVLLGRAEAGTHTIRVQIDPETTSRQLREPRAASIQDLTFTHVLEGDAEHTPVSLAPILYARPNTVGRFTDVPVFAWYETEPTSRGVRYRYTVIFTNEDGGTPTDRLMATWGRASDIEYVYSVEVDRGGAILEDDLQGPEHEILRFGGKREGRHPLLWVSTDNNMVRDTGTTTIRYAPAPAAMDLRGVSREVVMDAHPWTYRVTAQELAREGKIVGGALPGTNTIPEPRDFVYVEGCGEAGDRAMAVSVKTKDGSWHSSDRGVPEYRVTRDGCYRVAIAVPSSATPGDVRALRVQAHERLPRDGTGPRAQRPARVSSINTLFMLDDAYVPGASLLSWKGDVTLQPGAAPLEIPVP